MFLCRVFDDPPADGAWNMSIDESLLDAAADDGVASLRFYRWRESTLSLGYFQRYAAREAHAASRGAAVVRRLSGGGALVHDRELTYSVCLPARHPLARQPAQLYGLVHDELVAVLAQFGVAAQLYLRSGAGQSAAEAPLSTDGEPFLCFARRSAADVVAHGAAGTIAKVAGSAQRRRRGAVLQHGAVLLDASPCAPELAGVNQLGERRVSADDLIEPWRDRLVRRLELRIEPAPGANSSLHLRKSLHAKYSSEAWIRRR